MKRIVAISLLILSISVLFYSQLYQNRPVGPAVYIGITPSGVPFSFIDDKNEPDGFDVDVAKLISKKLDLTPTFVVKKEKKLIKDIKSGDIHLIAGLQKTLGTNDLKMSNVYFLDAPVETCIGISTHYGEPFIKQVNKAIADSETEIKDLKTKWHL